MTRLLDTIDALPAWARGVLAGAWGVLAALVLWAAS